MDAFSSDSIPTHLLTLEAIREYRKKIKNDGLIFFHVSNRHVDLVPVLVAAAEKLELEVKVAQNAEREESRILPTRWVAMGNPEGFSRHLADCPDWGVPATHSLKIPPWTDGFSNLLYVLTLN